MQVNKTSGTNFTGVIPVRVFQNGKEVLEKNLVRKTCLEVINGLAGPIKDNPQFKQTAAMLSVMDHDYKFARAFHGYSRVIADKKLTPSDFFKIKRSKNFCSFLKITLILILIFLSAFFYITYIIYNI